ncbi:MAG: FAD-binding oxidoreductase [Rhodovibrionaceae bacterium]
MEHRKSPNAPGKVSAEKVDIGALQEKLAVAVGAEHVVPASADLSPHLEDERGLYVGRAPFIVFPGTAEEVAETVRLCAEAGAAMVPQGGNTSLVGASIPMHGEVLIGLKRLNRVRALDPANFTITVEAGVILQDLQRAAEEADRLFPLSLGAEGSCMIGGNLSTNAGGVQVLRYGNTRDLVLGIEAVLPDGRIWNGLRGLRKDNTGYDLKQLFIGGEGTLGIITAAVLKLFPRPREVVTAFAAVTSVAAAVELLGRIRTASGDAVCSFELIPRRGLAFALEHVSGVRDPLAAPHDWYVLIELHGGQAEGGLSGSLEAALAEAYEAGLVADAALAANAGQAGDFWRIREAIVEAQKKEGGSIKHDVSVPVSRIPEFIERGSALVAEMVPGIRPVPFGHLGDGNIHFNLSQPEGAEREAFLARWDEVNHAVHDLVAELGGSISAEHGIGQLKIAENARFKPPVELEMMRAVKKALDPQGLMNPGKLLG